MVVSNTCSPSISIAVNLASNSLWSDTKKGECHFAFSHSFEFEINNTMQHQSVCYLQVLLRQKGK